MTIHHRDVVERGGYRFRVDFEPDYDHAPPWEDGDGQGIVRELRYGETKRPGDRILHHSSDRRIKFAFDWQATIAKAKKEQWGLSDEAKATLERRLGRPPTTGEVVAQSVEQNFQWMRGFLRDEWEYVGIVITYIADGESDEQEPDYGHAVWGFDTDSDDYLQSEAESMIEAYVRELDKEKAENEAAEERAKNLDYGLGVAIGDLEYVINTSDLDHAQRVAFFDELAMLARAAGVKPPLLPLPGSIRAAMKLWRQLAGIPVDDYGYIEQPFNGFMKGTDREDIWHWFERNFEGFSVAAAQQGKYNHA